MADWNVSVDIAFLDTPLTIASTSENPKKFERFCVFEGQGFKIESRGSRVKS